MTEIEVLNDDAPPQRWKLYRIVRRRPFHPGAITPGAHLGERGETTFCFTINHVYLARFVYYLLDRSPQFQSGRSHVPRTTLMQSSESIM